MSAMYNLGTYDIAGFCVGIVDYDNMLPKMDEMVKGDIIIGLPSSGIHSNGYSLINYLIEQNNINLMDNAEFSKNGSTYGDFRICYIY